MTSHSDFILWLNGFVEALGGAAPTAAQWAVINAKLDSCFDKVTPNHPQGRTVRIGIDDIHGINVEPVRAPMEPKRLCTCADDPHARAMYDAATFSVATPLPSGDHSTRFIRITC